MSTNKEFTGMSKQLVEKIFNCPSNDIDKEKVFVYFEKSENDNTIHEITVSVDDLILLTKLKFVDLLNGVGWTQVLPAPDPVVILISVCRYDSSTDKPIFKVQVLEMVDDFSRNKIAEFEEESLRSAIYKSLVTAKKSIDAQVHYIFTTIESKIDMAYHAANEEARQQLKDINTKK